MKGVIAIRDFPETFVFQVGALQPQCVLCLPIAPCMTRLCGGQGVLSVHDFDPPHCFLSAAYVVLWMVPGIPLFACSLCTCSAEGLRLLSSSVVSSQMHHVDSSVSLTCTRCGQGVHSMFEGMPGRPWKDGEPRTSRMVFIGRDLDEKVIKEGFQRCLIKEPSLAS